MGEQAELNKVEVEESQQQEEKLIDEQSVDKDQQDVDQFAEENNQDLEVENEDVFEFDGKALESPTNTEEQEDETAPQWVKDLRKSHKEDQRRIKELEQMVAERKAEFDRANKETTPSQELEIPPFPTAEDSDFDDDKHNVAIQEWIKKRDEIVSNNNLVKQSQEENQKQYQEKFSSYQTQREEVMGKLKGYEEAEQVVIKSLPVEKQNVIIAESTKPALVAYALGKNPELLKQFSEAKSPIEQGRILGMIESKVNIVSRPRAKTNVTPQVPTSGTPTNRGLETAIEKARKNGDYTKVMQLKRQLNK